MTFQQSAVTQVAQSDFGVTIKTQQESLTFDHCAVACGSWSKELLKGLNYHFPIEAERSYSLSLTMPEKIQLSLNKARSFR